MRNEKSLEQFQSCSILQAKVVEPRFSAAASRPFLVMSRVSTRRHRGSPCGSTNLGIALKTSPQKA